MVTLEIHGLRKENRKEVEWEVGSHRLYLKGTNPEEYVDLERSQADLALVNLNLIPGIRAKLLAG
jgi:hypothetical protein